MTKLDNVLDYLCRDHLERKIVDAIRAADDDQLSREFWLRVHSLLVDHSSCVGFDQYHSIARCHVLCVVAEPDCSGTWASIVLEELTRRANAGASFNAYVMGSQLGLFQAGHWLQVNKQALIDENFLPAVARYCTILFGKGCVPVNIDSSSYNSEIVGARQALDRVVKNYLSPQHDDLVERIDSEISQMLPHLQQAQEVEGPPDRERTCGADRWLFDALLFGSIDITRRDHNELIQAALAIHTLK